MHLNCGVGEDSWESPLDCKEINQSILKEISAECSLEGLMLKLKLQYLGHLMRRIDLVEKTLNLERLKAGGEGDEREWDGWMASQTRWKWVWVSSRSWWWTGKPGMLLSIGLQRVGHDWATELNLFTYIYIYLFRFHLLDRSYGFVFLCLTYFSQYNALQVHPIYIYVCVCVRLCEI